VASRKKEDEEDCPTEDYHPVTRRECSLMRETMSIKINSLRKELIIVVSVSTTWITLFILILNYIGRI